MKKGDRVKTKVALPWAHVRKGDSGRVETITDLGLVLVRFDKRAKENPNTMFPFDLQLIAPIG